MNMPKISVVTPSFNQAEFLRDTLESVLSQNYPNLEYIVIDGGSTDGSVDIIHEYSGLLQYWVSQPDSGQSEAINKGFARASGEIFCWINSDDYLEPNALNVVADCFNQHPDWQVINGGCRLDPAIRDNNGQLQTIRHLTHSLGESLANWNANWFAQQSTFWRSELWRTAGPLREDLHFAMDFELWHRFSKLTEFQRVEQVLATYRFHESAKCTSLHGAKCKELFALLSEWAPLPELPFAHSVNSLFDQLATDFDAQQDELQRLRAETSWLKAKLAMQLDQISALDNSRAVRAANLLKQLLHRFSLRP